jgi:hypothetical protein
MSNEVLCSIFTLTAVLSYYLNTILIIQVAGLKTKRSTKYCDVEQFRVSKDEALVFVLVSLVIRHSHRYKSAAHSDVVCTVSAIGTSEIP